MNIKNTKNYKKFSLLPMNREIRSEHVEKLIKSIKTMGIIRPVIVCKTDVVEGEMKNYIIDGQHLATACESENLAIPYVTITCKDEIDIVNQMGMLNNSSKSWALIDYVNAYKFCFNDYRHLLKFKNLYNLELNMVAALCTHHYSLVKNSQTIKSGTFTITNDKAAKMCKEFSEIFLMISNVDRSVKFSFLNSFMQSYSKISQKNVLFNLKKNLKQIQLIADTTEASNYIKHKVFNLKK
jgi:hypothetical protein|tara:strand:+ start:3036 stop:3752 length:717 start_codon:yes stop_codon:yes gene_type:complete